MFMSAMRLLCAAPSAPAHAAVRILSASALPGCSLSISTATSDSGSSSDAYVSLVFRGANIKVKPGTQLRAALIHAGLTPHNGATQVANCGDNGLCSSCAVIVSGDVAPPGQSRRERTRLRLPPHRSPENTTLRLACQVLVKGDIQVVKLDKLFGQGGSPLPDFHAAELVAMADRGK